MLAAGFFLLRAKTCEPAGKLLFFLYLAVQVQFICHNVTFYIYNIWFAGMLQWDYTWGDILGYGLLMLLLTPLFAWASRRIYLRLRTINSRQYMRLWLIPLLFILLHILQSSFFTISRYAYVAVGIRIMIDVCAFITYSQMASAISSAAKAAREAEQRDGLVRQLDLQRARAEDLESQPRRGNPPYPARPQAACAGSARPFEPGKNGRSAFLYERLRGQYGGGHAAAPLREFCGRHLMPPL